MEKITSHQRGFMLLEGMLALLVFSLGVLALVGLQAASIKNASDAKYRTDASFLANEMIGRLWGDRTVLVSTYAAPTDWQARVSSTLPGGSGNVVIATDPNSNQPRATVTVTWQLPGGNPHTFVTVAQITGAK